VNKVSFFKKNLPAFILIFTIFQIASGDIFVAPNGSDSNPGTYDKPFAAVAKAMEKVAEMTDGMSEDIIVHLREGVYRIDESIIIDESHSGQNGHKVIIQNYPKEKPVISGGVIIDGWTVHDQSKNIYKADAGSLNFRQLYVNDEWTIRSRHPNVADGEFTLSCYVESGTDKVHVMAGEVCGWKYPEDVEIHGQNGGQWSDVIYHIEQCFGSYVTVPPVLAALLFYPDQNTAPSAVRAGLVCFENAYEALDIEGEWFLDIHDGMVYYIPSSGQDMSSAEVIVPVVERLVDVHGSSLDNMVHDIVFFGIHFMHSTWMHPSTDKGFLNVQAGQMLIAEDETNATPAVGFNIQNAHDIMVERCVFTNMGSTAIGAEHANENISITGNVIKDVAGAGILIAPKGVIYAPPTYANLWDPADPRERCINAMVNNNYVTRTGRMYYSVPGINAGYATGATIEHNEVFDVHYSGVSCGWGWSDNISALENNLIQYNDIHHVLKSFQDGACIYTLGPQAGSRIFQNYLHDVPSTDDRYNHMNRPVYLDAYSWAIPIEENVIVNFTDFEDQNAGNQAVIDNAGLEPEYEDIVKLEPAPSIEPSSSIINRFSKSTEGDISEYKLYDMRGKLVSTLHLKSNLVRTSFDRLNLPAGMYIIKKPQFGALKTSYIR
jgi:hypothetical protein